MKINKFIGNDYKMAFAINIKKYRYWICDWTIEKFPIYHVDNEFVSAKTAKQILINNSETYVWDLRKFWKGFQPKLGSKEIQMLINKIELLNEDIECVHLYLDKLGVDRKENNETLSIVGRIKKLVEKYEH